jgi:hypothetical protein
MSAKDPASRGMETPGRPVEGGQELHNDPRPRQVGETPLDDLPLLQTVKQRRFGHRSTSTRGDCPTQPGQPPRRIMMMRLRNEQGMDARQVPGRF